jgi:hypothetical protein
MARQTAKLSVRIAEFAVFVAAFVSVPLLLYLIAR